MVKLVSQFDNEKTKLSLATPTCGCCCCCCCIIASITTASVSGRNFGNYVEKELPDEPDKAKLARNLGFWQMIGLSVAFISVWYILSSLSFGAINFVFYLLAGLLYLFFTTSFINKQIKISNIALRVALFTILGCILFIAEFFLGANLIVQEYGWIYLGIVILTSIIGIIFTFKNKKDRN